MKRIVICDDEPHVLEGLRYLLKGPDRRIETAATGKEGLERVMAEVPDLLITDVMMPEMSGLELIAQLRAEEGTKDLPIVIITAKGEAQDATLAQEVWGAMVIAKPFEPRMLRELVTRILSRETCPQPGSI
jgi:DNA-binding response OmpR family regulator